MDPAELVDGISRRIGYMFQNGDLLREALIHKSHHNERPGDQGHNERLEFLGDAVLDLVMSETLMRMLPLAPEGELTQGRAALVNESSLADLARQLDLGPFIMLGKGEEKNNGRQKPSILSDALEAIIGAVYLDGGFEVARDTILAWFSLQIAEVASGSLLQDPKTDLQETLQARGAGTPTYRVVESTGPDHDKEFVVEVFSAGSAIGRGRGKTKKDAEKHAARSTLEHLKANGDQE